MTILSKITVTALIMVSSITGIGFCSEPADSTASFGWSEPAWGQFFKVFMLLILVIAIIWICMILLKRAMGMRGGAARNFELAGGIPLGSRKSIQFIKIGASLYLVGVTENNISLINVIDNKDEIDNITSNNTQSGGETFFSLLKRVSGRSGARSGK